MAYNINRQVAFSGYSGRLFRMDCSGGKMFQDIAPLKFNCEFKNKQPGDGDCIIVFCNGCVLFSRSGQGLKLPNLACFRESFPENVSGLRYLFSVGDVGFFLCIHPVEEKAGFRFANPQIFRKVKPAWLAFAGATAAHLGHWYERRKFCGKCGGAAIHKTDERAMLCPKCEVVEYPKISPVVIVAVCDGDRLLLTKAALGSYKHYALVAGYVEIGETLEDAAQREVMEEVGLGVKNLRYYKSQPWGFSGSLLSGFFAELDGSDQVLLDTLELSEAKWFNRKDIPPGDTNFSLTWNMIEIFRQGVNEICF